MFKPDIIQQQLFNVVGWAQSENPEIVIEKHLTETLSGLTYQSQHPLLTLENLKATSPDFMGYLYPHWQSGKAYPKGKKLVHEEKIYISDEDENTETPGDGELWKVVDDFSEWLERETKAAIIKGIQLFMNKRILEHSAAGLLTINHLYAVPEEPAIVEPAMAFVGVKLLPIRIYGATSTVSRIGLMFDEPCEVNIEIYHSSSNEKLADKVFEYTQPGKVQWFNSSFELVSYNENIGFGGAFILGFKPGDIVPTGANPPKLISAYRAGAKYGRYINAKPFTIEAMGAGIWSDEKDYFPGGNNGLLMQINTRVDYTDFIVSEKQIFQDVIAKQVAVHFLRLMAFNSENRINHRNQNIDRIALLYEIDGDSQGTKKSGLAYELSQAVEAVAVDVSKLDKSIFKKALSGVKYKTR